MTDLRPHPEPDTDADADGPRRRGPHRRGPCRGEAPRPTPPRTPLLATEPPADEVVDADDRLTTGGLPPPVESPYDRPGRWYVVHTQSGYEKKVKHNLEARRPR